jgi:hypothetical protein
MVPRPNLRYRPAQKGSYKAACMDL